MSTETGHAKNVAQFQELIAVISGYGASYNPTKASIKLPALQTLAAAAQTNLAAVNTTLAPYQNAVAAREVAFAPLSKLATRVLNAVKATDTTPQGDENVQAIIRKIKGQRATAKLTEAEKAKLQSAPKEISSSQMSYDNRIAHLDQLIKLLTSIALYTPNENELKVATLTTLYNDLKIKNTAVITNLTALSNARITRNEVLYKPNTGMVDTALDAKTYIKSLFGTSSPLYRLVGKIRFLQVK
jgi:hypothetical protein